MGTFSPMSPIVCLFVLQLFAWSKLNSNERSAHCLITPQPIMTIGDVLDLGLEMGKQQKIAKVIAVQEFNHLSCSKLDLKIKNSHWNSTHAVARATNLLESKQVTPIIGTITHNKSTLASEINNKTSSIPILSSTSPAARAELLSPHSPYFIKVGDDVNINLHMQFIAAIIGQFKRQKITPFYDATLAIGQASKKLQGEFSLEEFSEKILSNNFEGLSGKTSFRNGRLLESRTFSIINVIGKSYIKLKLWSPSIGFSKNLFRNQLMEVTINNGSTGVLGKVHWPRGLLSVPNGWTDTNNAIGVPAKGAFGHQFVIVNYDHSRNETSIRGFSIDIFNAAVRLLPYHLLYELIPFNGSYDEMVEQVHKKEFDADLGDMEIMAHRYRLVDFTQPYVESGHGMVVAEAKSKQTWMFLSAFEKGSGETRERYSIQSHLGLYVCGTLAALASLYPIICLVVKNLRTLMIYIQGTLRQFLVWSYSKLQRCWRRINPVTDARNGEETATNCMQNPVIIELADAVMAAQAP